MTERAGIREQIVAAYQADPTLTVRQLQDKFKVGKSTVSRWLQDAGVIRARGARKGAPMRSRLTPTARHADPLAADSGADDFQRWLVGWYGEGHWRRKIDAKTQAGWLSEHTQGGVILSAETYALTCRAVGKSWRDIALDLLIESATGMTRTEYDATFQGVPYPPVLLRRAALGAVDLKRRVVRRLDALAKHPDFAPAAAEFRANWLDAAPEWMATRSRSSERD
jgi:hypothetical protein